MIWDLIGTIGGKVLDIVDDVVEDKDAANNLKFQIQKQLIERSSFNKLHHHGKMLINNDIIDLCNVWMVKKGPKSQTPEGI